MEQQVEMLLHQVMEVSDRLRLDEESSEQVRQTIAESIQGSMSDAGSGRKRVREIRLKLVAVVRPMHIRYWELTIDDSDSERFAARYQQENFSGGCFVLGQDGFKEDECKNSPDQWRHDLEMQPMRPN